MSISNESQVRNAVGVILEGYARDFSLVRGGTRKAVIAEWCSVFGVSNLQRDFMQHLRTANPAYNIAESKHGRSLFLKHPVSTFYLWLNGLLVRIVPNSFRNNSALLEILDKKEPDALLWDEDHGWCFGLNHENGTLFLHR